jgi:hypothetical protein
MLTLDHGSPMVEQFGPDARPTRLTRTTDYAIDPDMPMAYESLVADAVCHLFSGLLIVEHLNGTPRHPLPLCSVTALAVTEQNISTALEELNECNLGFWRLLPQARIRASERPPGYRESSRCDRDFPGHHAVGTKSRKQSEPASLTQGANGGLNGPIRQDDPGSHQMDHASITHSEWEDSLASAVLHLVGAFRAMETLSASAFPAGAPGSFEVACHCLCSALVTLDTCLAGCAK